jgi:hypothetical protein
MPAELAGEVLGGAIKFIVNVVAEVVIELLVKGIGYLICKPFKKNIDPDGGMVIFVGLAFWLFVILGGYFAYDFYVKAWI